MPIPKYMQKLLEMHRLESHKNLPNDNAKSIKINKTKADENSENHMIDSHCHVDSADFDSDRDEVVARAKATGLFAFVNAGNSPKDNRRVMEIAEKYKGYCFPTLAVSPHHACEITDEEFEAELRYIESNRAKLVGIGETGLDRHHFKKEDEWHRQEKLFRAHIQLGEALDLPVVIHSRDAEERCIHIAEEYDCRIMLHCFLEHKAIDMALESDFMISVPTLKSKGINKIIKKTPLERLLCETDSPWLWQGGRNEPSNVKSVYERVAKIKSQPFEKVVETVDGSASSFFGIKRI